MKTLTQKSKTLIILLGLIVFIQSCNVHIEKRRYRKGYYVEVSNKGKKEDITLKTGSNDKVSLSNNDKAVIPNIVNIQIDSLKAVDQVETHKVQKKIDPRKKSAPGFVPKKLGDDQCDIINMKDGSAVEALIVQISETEILYKKCNNPDGPSYVISPSKIKSIELKNGDIYIPEVSKGTDNSKITGGMIATIVLAGIALICIIAAMAMLGYYYGFIKAIPLAIAGITSLVGLLIGTKYLKKESHGLGKAGFWTNLGLQILAIILTVLMFVGF